MVNGVSSCLDLVKRRNSAAKLAMKHTILNATVNSYTGHSLARQVERLLGVHHCNVLATISKKEVINNNRDFVCMLLVQKKRIDGLRIEERKLIIEW